MKKKILKFFLIIAPVFVLLAVVGFYVVRESSIVTVVRPVRGPAVQAVYATGTVEPVVMLPVAPRASSRLMELLIDEGGWVTKDSVLARLEDTDIRKELADAQAKANFAQQDYERKNRLVKSGAVSRQSLEEAITSLQSAQATAERIKATLSYMTLLAPDDGIVVRRDGEIGELITAGEVVFWLAGQAMRITAEVDEEDIALVIPGQKTLIYADAFPGEVFEGTVRSITPKGDPVARSYRVRIALPSDSKLMIGMTAESNIIIRESQNALLLPVETVQNRMVWVVRGEHLEKRAVKIGAQNAEYVEILEGVLDSDMVIKAPASNLSEDSSILIRLEDWKT